MPSRSTATICLGVPIVGEMPATWTSARKEPSSRHLGGGRERVDRRRVRHVAGHAGHALDVGRRQVRGDEDVGRAPEPLGARPAHARAAPVTTSLSAMASAPSSTWPDCMPAASMVPGKRCFRMLRAPLSNPDRGGTDDARPRSSSTRSPTTTSTTRPRCTGACATRRRCTSARSTASTRCPASPTCVAAHRDWQGFSSAHGIDLSTLSKDPEMIRSLREHHHDGPARARPVAGAREPRVHAAGGHRARADDPRGHLRLPRPARRTATSSTRSPTSPALFPVEIISRMLGVPEGERQQIRHWLDVSLHREPGEMDPTPEGTTAVFEHGRVLHRAHRREARATRATTC